MDDTVQFLACERMAQSHKTALIMDDGQLDGVRSFKDVVSCVIAAGELPLGFNPCVKCDDAQP
jgi:hypothetical protein